MNHIMGGVGSTGVHKKMSPRRMSLFLHICPSNHQGWLDTLFHVSITSTTSVTRVTQQNQKTALCSLQINTMRAQLAKPTRRGRQFGPQNREQSLHIREFILIFVLVLIKDINQGMPPRWKDTSNSSWCCIKRSGEASTRCQPQCHNNWDSYIDSSFFGIPLTASGVDTVWGMLRTFP